ncbi:hypothetical protein L2E82_44883 [Cichorium intybus]|uniref:Uncharacterized protein n=1 Tax=Cichorium intybus TaxID=13427 RepID=A0ACB8ZS01_CICIN|nr:hypothetical protein L2E82_44883 [Cichorium intybus]
MLKDSCLRSKWRRPEITATAGEEESPEKKVAAGAGCEYDRGSRKDLLGAFKACIHIWLFWQKDLQIEGRIILPPEQMEAAGDNGDCRRRRVAGEEGRCGSWL